MKEKELRLQEKKEEEEKIIEERFEKYMDKGRRLRQLER